MFRPRLLALILTSACDPDQTGETDSEVDSDTVVEVCPGYGGHAASFDGGSFLHTLGTYAFRGDPADVTVEFWVRLRARPTDQTSLLDWSDGRSQSDDLNTVPANWIVDIVDDAVRFTSDAASADPDVALASTLTTADVPLPLDAWTHVAFVVISETREIRLYQNGVETGVARPPDAWWEIGLQPSHILYIGGRGLFSIDGEMDDLRIWGEVRTPEELLASMCTSYTSDIAPDRLVEQVDFETFPVVTMLGIPTTAPRNAPTQVTRD